MKHFAFFFCFALIGQACGAEETPWYNPKAAVREIRGTVVDESGQPVPGIRISECGAEESPPYAVETDESGHFTFSPGLPSHRSYLLAESADRSLLGIRPDRLWQTGEPNKETAIVLKPARTITGTVKGKSGEPVPDAQIIVTGYHCEIVKTLTDAGGEFRFQYPADLPLEAILALKNGTGFDYLWTLETPTTDERRNFGSEGDPDARKKSDGPFTLTLDGVKPVRFQCVDDSGQPLPGVEIGPWIFRKPNYLTDLNVWISQYKRTSDAEGNVEFDYFPVWHKTSITFWADKPGFLRNRIDLSPESFERANTARMRRAVAVRGTLRFPDGTPAPNWTVRAQGDGEGSIVYKDTDGQGRYEIMAAPNSTINLNAEKPRGIPAEKLERDWVAVPQLNIETGSDPILVRDFTLEKGTRISGRATAGADNEPVPENTNIIIFCRTEEGEDVRSLRSWWWERTGEDGTFEFWIAPGHYEMQLQYGRGNEPRSQITVEKGVEQTVNFHAEKTAAQVNRRIRGKAVLGDVDNPVPGAMVSSHANDFIDQTGLQTDNNGDFQVRIKNEPLYVEVVTPDGLFGKMVIVEPNEDEFVVPLEPTATIRGKIVDRRSENPPVGREVIYQVRIPSKEGWSTATFFRETAINEKGEFEFRGLPTGVACDLNFPTYLYGEEESHGSTFSVANELKLQPGEVRELGDRTFDSRSNGYEEYLFQVYNVYGRLRARGEGGNLYEQRFDILLERARRDGKGIFAILVQDKVDEEGILKALQELYVTLFKDDDMFAQTERYYMMCVLMQPKEEEWRSVTAAMAQEFVKSHLIALPTPFSFAFFDPDGLLKGVEPFDHTEPPDKQKQALIEMLKTY